MEISAEGSFGKSCKSYVLELVRLANRERSGILAGALVFFLTAIVSWIGWLPLSLPGRLIGSVVNPGDCGSLGTGTVAMYFCSAKVAILALVGPLAIITLLIVCRKWLTKHVGDWAQKLPPETRFLFAPSVACLVFALAWAPLHYQIADNSGLVPQRTFPAVVALFTYASIRYGSVVQRNLARTSFFEHRDKLSGPVRGVLAALIPLAVSFIITFQDRVSNAARKEQVVTLVALCTCYLALTPQEGDLLSGVKTVADKTAKA